MENRALARRLSLLFHRGRLDGSHPADEPAISLVALRLAS